MVCQSPSLPPPPEVDGRPVLSRLETRVLDMVAAGARQAQIKAELGLTLNGVKKICAKILRRLGVNHIREAIMLVVQNAGRPAITGNSSWRCPES